MALPSGAAELLGEVQRFLGRGLSGEASPSGATGVDVSVDADVDTDVGSDDDEEEDKDDERDADEDMLNVEYIVGERRQGNQIEYQLESGDEE